MNTATTLVATLALVAANGVASASINVTQGTSGTTYSTTLNFDEVGGPTGSVATNAWAGIGLADIQSGAGMGGVGDVSGFYPWINSVNAFEGAFGIFMTFDSDLTNFNAQVWDPSGAPSPFGGGAGIFLLDDGAEVGSLFFEPAWGGLGDTWLDVVADGGMVFDEVRILGFGFSATTYMDNVSWNAVPAPSSAALLGFAGLTASRRRRA